MTNESNESSKRAAKRVRTHAPRLIPSRAMPAMLGGLVLIVPGVVVFFAGLMSEVWLTMAAGIALVVGGVPLFSWGKRQRSIVFDSADEAIERLSAFDGSINLYLRPFDLDNDSEYIGTSSDGVSHFVPIESIITSELRQTGRLLAIGSIDDNIMRGSYRVFIPEETWWDDARRLMALASIVVIRPGAPGASTFPGEPRGILREFEALPRSLSQMQILLVIFRSKDEHRKWSTVHWPALERLITSLSDHDPGEVRTQLVSLAIDKKEKALLLLFQQGQLHVEAGEGLRGVMRNAVNKNRSRMPGVKPLPQRRFEWNLARGAKVGYLGFIGCMGLFWITLLLKWLEIVKFSAFLWFIPALVCLLVATVCSFSGGQDPDVF